MSSLRRSIRREVIPDVYPPEHLGPITPMSVRAWETSLSPEQKKALRFQPYGAPNQQQIAQEVLRNVVTIGIILYLYNKFR